MHKKNINSILIVLSLAAISVILPATVSEGSVTGTAFGGTAALADNTDRFVPVTLIDVVSNSVIAGTDLNLSGKVYPSDATNKEITWSVRDPGVTGAVISGDVLSAPSAGKASITATIENGLGPGRPYTRNITISVTADFVPVTDIDVVTVAVKGVHMPLMAIVNPSDATNKVVVLSVKDAGGTGASITDDRLYTTGGGKVIINATIIDGRAVGTDFTEDFTFDVISFQPDRSFLSIFLIGIVVLAGLCVIAILLLSRGSGK